MTGIDFAQAGALAGAATVLATEVLKSRYVPVPAKEHPRLTALILAAVFSGYEVYAGASGNLPHSLVEWVALTATALVAASLAYNNILRTEEQS